MHLHARFPELITESMNFLQFQFKYDTKHCGFIALDMTEWQAGNEAKMGFDECKEMQQDFWTKLPNMHLAVRNRVVHHPVYLCIDI